MSNTMHSRRWFGREETTMGSSATEVEQLLQAARLHLAKGELQEAVEHASEVIHLDGKKSAAYLVRAEAHRRLKRPERAPADLAVAIRLDSNQPSPYVIRAETPALSRRGRTRQPHDPEAYSARRLSHSSLEILESE
jgi:tetratricopeptide (TPR) repeat protein